MYTSAGQGDINLAGLLALTVADLESAYEGPLGRCACGCSGKYFYVNVEDAPYNPESFDPAAAERLLAKVQRAAKAGKGVDYWTYSNGTGGWGYNTKSRMFNIYTKKVVAK